MLPLIRTIKVNGKWKKPSVRSGVSECVKSSKTAWAISMCLKIRKAGV